MAQFFQELNEDQWILIQELMGWSRPKERGKSRTSLKRVWNAILYILTHGCRWEDLPKDARYAHKATAHLSTLILTILKYHHAYDASIFLRFLQL